MKDISGNPVMKIFRSIIGILVHLAATRRFSTKIEDFFQKNAGADTYI